MAKDKIVVGIDIGSSKISTIIATLSEDEKINVMGAATTTAKGIRKSQVVDIEEAVSAISESLEKAERMAGYSVGAAVVSLGGMHIECQNSRGVVAVSTPEGEISQDDVRRVTEAAQAISLSSSREIIHVIPRFFIVDSQIGVKDPVGMTGIRLEIDTHIITGSATAARNLAKCVQELGVDIEGLVFSGVAAAEAVLTETEKELGVILVDLGGGTTSICIFVDGSLSHSAVLPVGAKNITNDLAIGLRVNLETAERIKLALSSPPKLAVQPEEEKEKGKGGEEVLDFASLGLGEEIGSISKKTLIDGIAKPRLKEILTMVKIEIQKSGFGGMTPAGLVVTGGGALTFGIIELAKLELAMPVRIGTPVGVSGLIDEVSTPEYAALVGLILYGVAAKFAAPAKIPLVGRVEFKGIISKSLTWLRSFFP